METTNNPVKKTYREYGSLDLTAIDREMIEFWEANGIFSKSVDERPQDKSFVFYEGPPSANGKPGVHHVISRTLKDLFCRYKTQKGFRVERKGGWDTHGLPVELSVEKTLGITKKDIGSKITVEEYNAHCRREVLKYKDVWDDLTVKMGYWVDLDDPYITFQNSYIESLWSLLKRLYDKDLLYKGYTIQPFSPAAGTQLSSHELNQPGAYRDVKDTTVVAQFKLADEDDTFFLAWTTTPWTLPSNTALAVGAGINYLRVRTYNQYTGQQITVILAKDLMHKYFDPELAVDELPAYEEKAKKQPYVVLGETDGKSLEGTRYEQLLPYARPEDGDAFRVITGDFVTTEDGTGIVHIAPSFGADDMRVAAQNGIGSLTLVNRQGRFVEEVTDFAGVPVKNYDDDPDYEPVDIQIAVKLKKENRAFKVEKYEHSYPHCWRTDKPVIYYPLDSWFIRATAVKDRMMELNKTINWKPSSTGEGRFGKWLENLIDWNLSRSRFWGTPLPIWRTEDGSEEKCIGSLEELRAEVARSVEAGHMQAQLADDFDLHKPYVDSIVLTSSKGEAMKREADLIDVWFDSGAMPYAQWHYPFENEETFKRSFPADFIAEGVDQTRGWFYTLHALAVMLEDSVAYKNVVSNGLVLDKNGNKMSKRLGNAVDPFETISTYGADATRWYMMSNAAPWDNLRFDLQGVEETRRKLFGTLWNTYAFFGLYANIDGFSYEQDEIPMDRRSEMDRWILSLLNSLVKDVDGFYADYEPTKATRAIQEFVDQNLSNWYVRLSRRVFWKGDYTEDKIAAYQTLYTCLSTIMKLMAPVAPFFTDFIWRNLNQVSALEQHESVHLAPFPQADESRIDRELEIRMEMAQRISSLVLSLRKKVKIKVRQPLGKVIIPVLDARMQDRIEQVRHYILSEVNVKEIEFAGNDSGMFTKKAKANFKKLGPRFGQQMKLVAAAVAGMDNDAIGELERNGRIELKSEGQTFELNSDDVEILTEDIPGWQVAGESGLTVALDVTITEELALEGLARELVNRIQQLRKQKDFDVTDRISLELVRNAEIEKSYAKYKDYICSEILAESVEFRDELSNAETVEVEGQELSIRIKSLKN